MPRTRLALRSIPVLPAAALTAMLCAASPAAAQQKGFALGRFDPAFAGDRLFSVQSPGAIGPSTVHAMFLVDYAHDPLVLRGATTGKKVGSVVSDQVTMRLDLTYALWRRLALNVDLPLSIQAGEGPSTGGVTFAEPSVIGLGDLRLGARATLYGEGTDPLQIALGAMLWIPTGTRSAFAGDGAARSAPYLVVGGLTRWFTWSTSIGAELRAARSLGTEVAAGAGFRWGAGMAFLPGDGTFQIGPEVHGAVSFADPEARSTDAEALVGARYRFARHFVVGLAAAVGLAPGVGTPDFRAIGSFAFSPEPPPDAEVTVDRDGDKIGDARDACPDEPGHASPDAKKNGCPILGDRDGDGILDAVDACPDAAGVPDEIPKINGCPPDRDNDEIPDAEDACPAQQGLRSADPKRNGCPQFPDRDHDQIPDDEDTCPETVGARSADPNKNGCPGDRDADGIYDDKDACPDEKGPPDPDPAKNGCPKDVRVTEGQIVIMQQVEFDTAKATIRPVSNGLLDTVANVLREHKEILRVEVQGHTDNRGSVEQNTAISQARAEAVVNALVKRGVERGRLSARGYGPTRPIMANVTTVGRQKNRRVEFQILERKPKAGGNDPPRK